MEEEINPHNGFELPIHMIKIKTKKQTKFQWNPWAGDQGMDHDSQ